MRLIIVAAATVMTIGMIEVLHANNGPERDDSRSDCSQMRVSAQNAIETLFPLFMDPVDLLLPPCTAET